jgi:hypothetical protein
VRKRASLRTRNSDSQKDGNVAHDMLFGAMPFSYCTWKQSRHTLDQPYLSRVSGSRRIGSLSWLLSGIPDSTWLWCDIIEIIVRT